MNLALDVRQLAVFSQAQQLVQETSLQIPVGASFTLLGESGSGKSLLTQAIMGNLPAGLTCSGQVQIGAHQSAAVAQHERHALWGRQIGFLPQEPWQALDPTMRVQRQIAETYALVSHPATNRQNETLRAARRQAHALAQQALQSLDLQSAGDKYPHMISGGMAQRVAFLATHAAGAPLLIVDEPTKGLDSDRRAAVLQLLRKALQDQLSLLVITHDVWLAQALGGQIGVMLDGRLVEQGSATEVLSHPRHAYTRRLLAADPANWTPHQPVDVAQAKTGAVIVRLHDVGKRFGAQTLLRGLSMEVRRGEFIAVTGPSGSGKTSLGNLMLGLLKPDQGSVERAADLPAIALQKIYQDPGTAFVPGITLRRSLRDLVQLHRLDWAELERLLARLHLQPALLERTPAQVSGGELQRFALARVLMLKPQFIFADEPTSRLDPITQQETLELLKEHAQEHACAVLLVTHDVLIARHFAERKLELS
jgi:peptide/nickel transport system ATP-binding protein